MARGSGLAGRSPVRGTARRPGAVAEALTSVWSCLDMRQLAAACSSTAVISPIAAVALAGGGADGHTRAATGGMRQSADQVGPSSARGPRSPGDRHEVDSDQKAAVTALLERSRRRPV